MNPVYLFYKFFLVEYSTPASVTFLWNFGFMLGILLVNQIVSGFYLACHYCSNSEYAFFSIMYIMRDVSCGWAVRDLHANGASFFFICMYLHIGRGIYYGSFALMQVWNIGVLIFILSMATAFLGYVLVWGQMSFWAATVITSLISVIPIFGQDIMFWLWGGFSVCDSTLNRFFALHFILPFIIICFVFFHLVFLHEIGSSSADSVRYLDFIPFSPFFIYKDFFSIFFLYFCISTVIFFYSRLFQEPDNYVMANSLVTPVHIKPEWYFLAAYSVLRSIPNKSLGVVSLVLFMMALFIISFFSSNMSKGMQFTMFYSSIFSWWCMNFILTSWMGGQVAEEPFVFVSGFFTFFYFIGWAFMNIL